MKVIGISGRKQSGKNTVANYISGWILKNRGMIKDFKINENGQLLVETSDNNGIIGWGIFDMLRKDYNFVDYAERELWPYIKIYHFADPLKEMCVNLFELNPQNIYGSDDDKNKHTPFCWKDMPGVKSQNIDLEKNLTHREFLEHFGTNVVRAIKLDVWSAYTMNIIKQEQSNIAIIPDVRFPNEVRDIKKSGGVVIRLKRDIFSSNATAETALDNWDDFDCVIDNKNCTIDELCDTLNSFSYLWSL
jgi:hypothetical protein